MTHLRLPSLLTAAVALTCLSVSPLFAQAQKAAQPTQDKSHDHAHEGEVELPTLGVAVVMPTKGNKVRGMLRLTQKGNDLHVSGKIRNLTPGEHGFHIHEFGDLRDMAEGLSAGGHFNPTGAEHGSPEHGHVGDLGNIEANEQGVATVDATLKGTKLHFVLGRTFVVHADRDDLTSQPSGNAGPRVGLGLIGVGNPEFKAAPQQQKLKQQKQPKQPK